MNIILHLDYVELPKSIDFNYQYVVFGFGFDTISIKYKVVKIIYQRDPRRHHHYLSRIIPPTPEVQVFTLGSPAWGRLGPYHFLQSPSLVLVSGMLHWCTWPQKYGPCRLLISLDLADERFRVVPKPDCGGLERCYFDLVNLGVTCLLLHIANLEYLRSGL